MMWPFGTFYEGFRQKLLDSGATPPTMIPEGLGTGGLHVVRTRARCIPFAMELPKCYGIVQACLALADARP